MPFIYGISVKNFKVFNEKTTLSFAPLTILTGANGSGKSTVNQSIALLKQKFNKPLIDLGSSFNRYSQIDFREIIKPIPIEILDKRTATFKNLVNNNSENDIIEFSIPSSLVDHGSPLEIVIRYRIEANDLRPANLESFVLRDTENDIPLFEVFSEMRKNKQRSGYYSRINYHYFFKQFREESSFYSKLMEVANEVFSFNDEDLIKNHPRMTEMKLLLDNFYGNTRPELAGEVGNYWFIDPEKHEFIEEDFIEFRKSLVKDFRMINDFARKYPYDADLFTFDHLIHDDQQRFDFLSKIAEGNLDNSGFSLAYHSRLLESLSGYKFSIAEFYGSRATDVGYTIFVDDHMSYPQNALYKLCKDNFNIEDFADQTIRHTLHSFVRQSVENSLMTNTGKEFFSKYVYRRIATAIRSTMVFQFMHINNAKVDLSSSRLVDLTRNEGGSNQILEFINHSHEFSNSLKDFANNWIKKFGIGEEINFDTHGVYTEIKVKKDGKVFNLSDEGLGISKLTPILINIINIAHNSVDITGVIMGSTLLLEEPEAGLHPALQSQLAEFFFDAYKKFNIQFIIETHSEYLIRKLQTMVVDSTNNMKPEHAMIYYFYHPEKVPAGSKQVVPIHIESDGSLSRNFGSGFFDESSNLNIALYNLTKANRN